MTQTTAKVRCVEKSDQETTVRVVFDPNYQAGANQAWAEATPRIRLEMHVKPEVAPHYEQGKAYTLTITPDED